MQPTDQLELERSAKLYRVLFDCMPIALCQIDTSRLLGLFKAVMDRGVRDLSDHIDAHPEFLDEALDALRVVDANLRSLQMFGARNVEELQGPVTRYWGDSRDAFRRALEARFRGHSRFEAQIKLRTLDHRSIDALFITDFAAPLAEMKVGLVGFVDISDRVKAQAMLAQMQTELAHAARVSLLGELSASIAHEVGQPLTAISTNTEATLLWLARSPPDVGEIQELCTRNLAEVQRAVNVIQRIRSMAIRAAPERQPENLNSIVADALPFLRPELQRREVTLCLELAPRLPDVLADRIQLQQVFVNLALNAVQAMSQGDRARRLTIRTARMDHANVLAEVDDTGPGVSVDHMDNLFQSFFSTKKGGMGMGLSICRCIVEAHGGYIRASNLGAAAGARFRFTLPANPG